MRKNHCVERMHAAVAAGGVKGARPLPTAEAALSSSVVHEVSSSHVSLQVEGLPLLRTRGGGEERGRPSRVTWA